MIETFMESDIMKSDQAFFAPVLPTQWMTGTLTSEYLYCI